MNKSLINSVKNKLNEYGYDILKQQVGDDDQYLFFCKDMIVFVHPDQEVSVTFQATTRPETAADNILTLKEIPDVKVNIMESFIFSADNKLITGDEAYDLVSETLRNEVVKEERTKDFYDHIMNNECINFYEC